MLRVLIMDAIGERQADVNPESLAIHIQAVLQGAFVMAKARQDARAAADSIQHLYRYVEMLFPRSTRKQSTRKPLPGKGGSH
jgi:TetR/AcrR family transcriptional repressor of nem operon